MSIARDRSRSRSGQWAQRCVVAFGAAVAVLFSASIPAGAATVRHVNKAAANCSDSGPGTAGTPLCTIGAAAGRAVAGDTVLVHTGTYAEQVTVLSSGTAALPITFAEAPGATVTVRGGVNGFRINSRSFVTVRGFTVVDTTGHGINVTQSAHITIEDNNVSGSGTRALGATGRGISLATTTDSLVRRNVTHDNSDAGIFLGLGSTGNVVSGNRSSRNARGYVRAAVGIDVRGASSQVSSNVVFDNEDSGINIWDGAANSRVVNNVSYRNGDHGIDNKGSNNTRILSNTVYRATNSGIEVVNSTGVTLANNISADNGSSDGNVFVDSLSAPTISLDYDLLHRSSPGTIIDFDGERYDTLAEFVAATGHEDHGRGGNPRFRNAAAGNFALTAGSPAIDSANSGVTGHPSVDAKGRARRDDPDTPNTGVGPRTFDDRGAYEFAPK